MGIHNKNSYDGACAPKENHILLKNKKTNQTIINIKGIAIGNAWIDDETSAKGMFDYWWTHALNSDATHDAILKYCDFASDSSSAMCDNITDKAFIEKGFFRCTSPDIGL
ncbi:putative carboxypeptidase D [Helianthus annuus]|nr:putative carboxypeptidase D [Helianthus annuus]